MNEYSSSSFIGVCQKFLAVALSHIHTCMHKYKVNIHICIYIYIFIVLSIDLFIYLRVVIRFGLKTVGSFPQRSLLVSFPHLSGFFFHGLPVFDWLAFNCPVWPAAVRSAVAFTAVLHSVSRHLKSRGLFAAQFTGVSVLRVSVSAITDCNSIFTLIFQFQFGYLRCAWLCCRPPLHYLPLVSVTATTDIHSRLGSLNYIALWVEACRLDSLPFHPLVVHVTSDLCDFCDLYIPLFGSP